VAADSSSLGVFVAGAPANNNHLITSLNFISIQSYDQTKYKIELTAARTRKRRDGKNAVAGEQINRERRRVVDARRKAKPDHVVNRNAKKRCS
jgi:hypothetical protein